MGQQLMLQLEFIIKLLAAGLCGAVIGYERENQQKSAGIRTHTIVAIGSALIMLVSKYGFQDVLVSDGYELDPSRIASQIVTGIGFLGAGVIIIRNQSINGLTTAAGIWTTAGIGMAIAADMYIAGVATAILVFFVQSFLNRELKWLKPPTVKKLKLRINDGDRNSVAYVRKVFLDKGIEIIDIQASGFEDGIIDFKLSIRLPRRFEIAELMDVLYDVPNIKIIDL